MPEKDRPIRQQAGRIKDARGRPVSRFDPVKLHMLNLPSIIPADALRPMVDQIMPGARRQRLIQVLSVALGFLVVVGGTIIYFRYFSVWKGFDPVNVTIYIIQVVVILLGPFLAFRMARAQYAGRVASVMLKHRRCPHCGYDMRGLPTAPEDGATVCPECGCAWSLGNRPCADDNGNGVSGLPQTSGSGDAEEDDVH